MDMGPDRGLATAPDAATGNTLIPEMKRRFRIIESAFFMFRSWLTLLVSNPPSPPDRTLIKGQ